MTTNQSNPANSKAGEKIIEQRLKTIELADLDKNGVLSSAEMAAYVRANVPVTESWRKINCANPESDVFTKLIAKTLSGTIDRNLRALAAQKPGMGAKEFAEKTYKEYMDITEALLDTSGIDQTMRAEEAHRRMKEDVAQAIEGDKFLISVHQSMVKRGEIGRLPTQALPMTGTDFCAAIKGR